MNLEEFLFLAQPEPWMDQAKCRYENPDLFFPERGETYDAALALCAACPVRKECDEYQRRTRSEYGVWGGQYHSPRTKRKSPTGG